MRRFAGIEEKYCRYENAAVLLQSIPYDGTSTWGKGADKGFQAFLLALENMELYDIETDYEAYKNGVHILDAITESSSPETVFQAVYTNTKNILKTDKLLSFFGGEHAISIGIIKAFYEKHPDITIVQLDAHADLRPNYLGTPYNHACAVHDASQNANLIQIGIRSMDVSEKEFLNTDKCFFAENIRQQPDWMDKALALIGEKVYLTIDLDVFDSSIMPSTGTPEPGGLYWYETLSFLKRLIQERKLLGFDIVELAPSESNKAPDFLVAKLYYKILSYYFSSTK
jgi:agmatinase